MMSEERYILDKSCSTHRIHGLKVHSTFTLVGGQMYIFDQIAINMVLLFHMHNEGPMIVFMQNGKDFFIYF